MVAKGQGVMEIEMNCWWASLGGDGNVLKLVVRVAQDREYIKNGEIYAMRTIALFNVMLENRVETEKREALKVQTCSGSAALRPDRGPAAASSLENLPLM